MINWKNKISKDDKYIDIQGLPYYKLKWDKKSKIQKVYEYNFVIPTEPKDEDCVNYGLSEHEQIFRRTLIPKQVKNPTTDYGRENWTQKQIDDFIDTEWSHRLNGIWFWIKGKKTYITGLHYMKMNYWTALTGKEFIYKFSDLEFFYFWMHCLYDPHCKGMIDFKCRQIGDTENVMLIMWEYGSRVRGTTNTMQSCINEDHVIGSYERLVHGHINMIYYFKPLNQGTENPKKGLVLNYPSKHMTQASVRDSVKKGEMVNRSSKDEYEHPPIGSRFKYGPSKITRFDGSTGVGRAYCDEFGKAIDMNPIEWLKTMVEATYSNIYGIKMGMIMMTSTVEDIGSDSLNWAVLLWNQSDPNKRKKDGSTVSGLYRCFRNAVDRGEVDRWGFPLKEKIEETIKETIKAYIETGDIKGSLSYRRKNCLTIEDVFTSANDESQFDIEKLTKRLFWLQNQAPKGTYVRGNLKWKDGVKDTLVVWEPNPKGKWIISKHPKDYGLQENAKVIGVISPKPANVSYFKAGLDPYDQQTTLDADPSKGGICVKRVLDEGIDGKEERYYQFDDQEKGIRKGDPVNSGSDFITNRVCCTYLWREADPNDFFEDVILTMVYYGTDFLPEKDKFGACHSYIKMRGYELYLMEKQTTFKNYKGQTETDGVSATTGNINDYFSYLTTLSTKWANTIDHPDLLEQLLSGNYKNRGRKDLMVACGWCEYAAMQPQLRFTPRKQTEVRHYTENYV